MNPCVHSAVEIQTIALSNDINVEMRCLITIVQCSEVVNDKQMEVDSSQLLYERGFVKHTGVKDLMKLDRYIT